MEHYKRLKGILRAVFRILGEPTAYFLYPVSFIKCEFWWKVLAHETFCTQIIVKDFEFLPAVLLACQTVAYF